MRKILIFTILFLSQLSAQSQDVPWGDGRSKAEHLTIKLVTFGTGDEVPAWWGHAGLIVEDHQYMRSKVYNFGLFSLGDGMLFNFVMGRLIFSAGDFNVPGYLAFYRRENRDIRIATLNLSDDKKLKLARKLAWSVLPENKDYLYHHYYDNCSTRLRDLVDEAVDGALAKATDKPNRMTLRDHTKRYVGHTPFMNLLIMFLMNDSIDKPVKQRDEIFLPDELENHVLQLSYQDSLGRMIKLVNNYIIVYESDREPIPVQAPNHWLLLSVTGIFLGLLSLILGWYYKAAQGITGRISFGLYQSLLGLIVGFPGLGLALMASFTDHTVTYYNENLLLANPVTFLLFPVGAAILMNKKRSIDWFKSIAFIQITLAVIALIIKIFPMFDQDNWMVFCFILPIWIGNMITSKFIFKAEAQTKFFTG